MQKKYLNRSVEKYLKKLFKNFPCVIITGARQTGKSTLLKEVFKTIPSVVFDPTIDIENARKDPTLFLENKKTPLILDEIQYAPELVSKIKLKIDENNKKPGQYLITGSQQWSIMKNIAESLAGRAVFVDLNGFSLAEIANKSTNLWLPKWINDTNEFIKNPPKKLKTPFGLYEQLWRGFLPEAQFLDLDLIHPLLQGYQRTYIERDLRVLAEISDFQMFGNFMQLITALTAQEINYNQLGRDIGLSPKTAKNWLFILKNSFQWNEIPAYKKNTIKKISSKSKGFFADTGQICFLQKISSPDLIGGNPIFGAIFETAVFNEIRKQCNASGMFPAIYHWKSYGGAEVDIILEINGTLFPIEIKSKSRVSRSDTTGITAFRKSYPNQNIAPGLVIAPTDNFEQISKNDYSLPWNSE